MKISQKIALFSVLIAVIPMLIVGISGYVKSYNMLIDNQLRYTEQIVTATATQLNKQVETARDLVNILSESVLLYGIEEGFKSFESIVTLSDDIKKAYIGVAETGAYYTYPKIELKEEFDPRQSPWYTIAESSAPVFTDPYTDAATGDFTVSVSKSVVIDNKKTAVVGIDFDFYKMSEKMDNVKVGKTGYIYVVNQNGTIMIHKDRSRIGVNSINKYSFLRELLAMKNGRLKYNFNGEKFVVFRTLEPYGWTVGGGAYMSEIKDPLKTLRNIAVLTIFITVVVVLVGVYFMTRSIVSPLNRAITGLTSGANEVASASNYISSSSQEMAEGASEQAASIEEASASMEEMSSMTQKNAENANHADSLTKESNTIIYQANESMKELTQSMQEISTASEATSKIIKTIDEIAFQTNLLALNAAVEAARAGDAGAGFAVVADEVRNLAMRAAEAAKDTSELIESTVAKIESGSKLVLTSNESFNQVIASATKVGQLVSEISEATNEQSHGIDQVNKAIAEMDKVVQQNATNAEESASGAEELNAQAEQLRGFVRELATVISGKNAADKVVQKERHKGYAQAAATSGNYQRSNEKQTSLLNASTQTRALAERYDNDKRLAYLQVGFGLWAEYHIYDGPMELGNTFPSKAYQTTFISHLSNAFEELPFSVSIDAADSQITPFSGDADLLALDFGLFDDSFLHEEHGDYNADCFTFFDYNNRYKNSPMGGELSYYTQYDQEHALDPEGPHGIPFEELSSQYHISYMIGNDQPNYQSMDQIKEAGMALGYEFTLTGISANQSQTNITVQNTGIAPIYHDAYICVNGTSATESLKGLLPGESKQYMISVGGLNPEITIACDRLVSGQTIQFKADL